jgi:subtilisin family serine protease
MMAVGACTSSSPGVQSDPAIKPELSKDEISQLKDSEYPATALVVVRDSEKTAEVASELAQNGGTVTHVQTQVGYIEVTQVGKDLPDALASVRSHVDFVALDQPLLLKSGLPAQFLQDEDLQQGPMGQGFMPLAETGVDRWREQYPNFDGRGVVIAILDTGVALDHPGLRTTSQGAVKIVDWQDFSGEGIVLLGSEVQNPAANPQGWLPVRAGVLREGDYRNSSYKAFTRPDRGGIDFNNDGDEDDAFGVWLVRNQARGTLGVIIDTDGDSSFEDEQILRPYAESHQFVRFRRGQSLLPVCVTEIAEDGSSVVLGFDDGGHGTHVAGIAAGHRMGDGTLSGVAPGAQIMSLKIGENRLSGGSTTTSSMARAMMYAATHGADIINLSYGIDSSKKNGLSTIDVITNRIADQYQVLFSVSAGNSGPGLNTVGIPAAAERAIASAAFLPQEIAASNYGWIGLKQGLLWYFSSAGPLLNGAPKPTLVSPGTALASTPDWAAGHRTFSGTSMAAPQTSGGLALMVSAAKQEGLAYTADSVVHAVKHSAVPIEGETSLRQGYGMLNVPGAYQLLKDHRSKTLHTRYELQHSFFRGGSVPRLHSQRVAPVFAIGVSDLDKSRYWRGFELQSSAGWLTIPSRMNMNAEGMRVPVRYDLAQLKKPGLYEARVTGRSTQPESWGPDFELFHTVVIPHGMNPQKTQLVYSGQVDVGAVDRVFVAVPEKVSALNVWLGVRGGGRARPIFFDPQGNERGEYGGYAEPGRAAIHSVLLNPASGTWEMDIYNSVAALDPAEFDLRLEIYGLQLSVPQIVFAGNTAQAEVRNTFGRVMVEPSAALHEFVRDHEVKVSGDVWEYEFAFLPNVGSVKFKIEIPADVYDQMTDFPVRIVDDSGKAVASDVVRADGVIFLERPKEEGKYRLVVMGAFSERAPEGWLLKVSEIQTLNTGLGVPLPVTPSTLSLESGAKATVTLQLPAGLPEPADSNYRWQGAVTWKHLRQPGEVLGSSVIRR